MTSSAIGNEIASPVLRSFAAMPISDFMTSDEPPTSVIAFGNSARTSAAVWFGSSTTADESSSLSSPSSSPMTTFNSRPRPSEEYNAAAAGLGWPVSSRGIASGLMTSPTPLISFSLLVAAVRSSASAGERTSTPFSSRESESVTRVSLPCSRSAAWRPHPRSTDPSSPIDRIASARSRRRGRLPRKRRRTPSRRAR